MQIAVCEDLDKDARLILDMLETYRTDNGLTIDVQRFADAEALLAAFRPGLFQILFMDIYMDKLTGVDAVRKIREQDVECAVIFTTTSEKHAVQGFALRATHYLIKPVDYTAFCEAMGRCKEQIDRFSRYIEVIENREPVQVRMRDILYAEVFKNYCIIHTLDRNVKAYMSIDVLETLLKEDSFFRCHRSYLVNLRHVSSLLDDRFCIKGGGDAFISRNFHAAAKRAFREFCLGIAEKTGVF